MFCIYLRLEGLALSVSKNEEVCDGKISDSINTRVFPES